MASDSQVKVALCSDGDVPAAFRAISKGFGHDAPFFDAYFPDHDTDTGQANGIKRLLAWKRTEENSYFLKAIIQAGDEQQEQIIGLGVWTHMKMAPPAELEKAENVEEAWPNEDDREYMKQLWANYVVPRSEVIEQSNGRGVYVLELLAVDRDHQRKGAGTALVQWGINAADRLGIEAIVEGTPEGRRTYEKSGFRAEIEMMKLDAGERFRGRKKPILTFFRKRAIE